ncbi:MAG: hypothetical protein HYY06_08300 [Deltaproteobacteria bacterium]|nr:hypothetical protein [Deltaproteobacteria bacterium]
MRCEHRTGATPEVDLQSVIRLHASLLGRLLVEGVRTGELRHDLPIEDSVWMLIGTVDIRVRQWHVGGVAFEPDLPRRLTDLLFSGVGR